MLKEGVKYNIDAIKPNGEPCEPKKNANKSVRQCGVLVEDQIPISMQEWKKAAKERPDLTFVDDRAKKRFGKISWNISPYEIIS